MYEVIVWAQMKVEGVVKGREDKAEGVIMAEGIERGWTALTQGQQVWLAG